MQKIKAAIIGTGAISHQHMEGLKNLAHRVNVVAAVDVDRARVAEFGQKYSIPSVYTDVNDMLQKEKPKLVHICTPPGLHCELSIRCLEAGAWVLCEKPLCASLEEFDRLQETERRTGNYCSSVFQMRFGSGAQHLKSLIDQNVLGRPLVGNCLTCWYRAPAYYEVPWRGKWSTELGGPTMIHGIHIMDLFFWLMGDWKEVQATIATLDRKIDVEDVSLAMVCFENGSVANICNSILCPRQETYLRLDFQKATVELKTLYGYTNGNWFFSVPDGKEVPVEWKNFPSFIPSSHGSQTAALLDSIEKNERPLVSGNEALRIIEFITCLYKSAATGLPVQRGSITKDSPFYRHVAGTFAEKNGGKHKRVKEQIK